MASKKELRALITLAGKIDPSLSTALMKASGENAKLAEKMKQTNKEFKNGVAAGAKFGDMLKASFLGNLAANGVSKLISSIKQIGVDALSTASSLIEVSNVVNTTFGDQASKIDAWSKTTLEAFGITELQAKQWSGSMGAMLKSSGIASKENLLMSESLAELAGDFASFYNLDHDEAWNKIRAGMSGETEPLKQLGINMSVANLEAFALQKGIKVAYKDMDQASQTLLRYNYLMTTSADAQGDFARTLEDSWENQKRLLKNSIMDKAASALSRFIPLFTDFTSKANVFVKNIDMDAFSSNIEDGFKLAGDSISWAKDNLNWLIPIAAGAVTIMTGFSILSTVTSLMDAWKASTIAQQFAQGGLNAVMAANPIGVMIVAIGALVAAGLWLWQNWDMVSKWCVGAWQDYVIPFFNGIGTWFSGIWIGMVDGFKFAWSGITSWFSGLWDGIIGAFKGYLNVYVSAFNFLIGGLNKIKFDVPDWVPGIGGKTIGVSIPTLPAFALGGIATQASIFGEAGPEMAIPLRKTPRSVSLLQQTAQILGVGTKGSGKIINIYINGGNLEEVKRVVLEVISGQKEDEELVSFG
ncbi:hypothetical protein [Cellulosilyticum sp. I15G10I2]|uniref:hypothetical protein n=1 Tax=Cellulosilyticum sp. I15G10I2 TaxID=1892843 RepID=UPI00085BD972|nr:hypothetical protein [Cellulosilyticum sp. I15G10I2]